MAKVSIISLTVLTAFVFSIACFFGILIGRRLCATKKQPGYPVPGDTEPDSAEGVLEDEAAEYFAGRKKEEVLLDNFKTFMIEQKPYLNSKVSIESVAASLGTNKTTLSKLINESFGMNFRQLLNSYRVKEALRILSVNRDISFEELRIASGFNSVSTFTTSFSRFTGCTPGEYCKKMPVQ